MIFANENAMELLKGFAESDDSITNPVTDSMDVDTASEIMDAIPEVDENDAAELESAGMDPSEVRIQKTQSGRYYIEATELIKFAEANKCDLEDATERILDHYPVIDKDEFVITIPDKDMQKTIKEAADGDQKAMHAIRDGSTLLRNMINKGLPVRKIVNNK